MTTTNALVRLTAAATLFISALALALNPSALDPRPNGMTNAAPSAHAFVGATVHLAPGITVENATVVIRNGEIISIFDEREQDIRILDGEVVRMAKAFDSQAAADRHYGRTATQHNASGLHITPAFIDAFTEIDAPTPDDNAPGRHSVTGVMPARSVLDGSGLSTSAKSALRSKGFAAANLAPNNGNFRGTSALVSLADDFTDPSTGRPPVYRDHTSHVIAFDSAGFGSGPRAYPTSTFGAISLVRQTLMDAEWQQSVAGRTPNDLDALTDIDAPLMFEVNHELLSLRATEVAREAGRSPIIVGNGTELRRLDALAEDGSPLVVPLRFPAKPDVSSVAAAEETTLTQLMLWEQAPTNLRRLDDAGLTVAITAHRLPKGNKFLKNLRRAVHEGGLDESAALAMLTTTPAELLGVSDTLGTIEPGKHANFILSTNNLFNDDAKILDLWIDGRRHEVNAPTNDRFDGTWNIAIGDFEMSITVSGKSITATAPSQNDAENEEDGENTNKARNVSIDGNRLSFLIDDTDNSDGGGTYVMSAVLTEGRLSGSMLDPQGNANTWIATRAPALSDYAGTWNATLSGQFELDLKITKDKITISEQPQDGTEDETITQDAETAGVNEDGELEFAFEHEPFGDAGTFTMTAMKDSSGNLVGTGTTNRNRPFNWTATPATKDPKAHDDIPDFIGAPFGLFTVEAQPKPQTTLFTNATVWTSGPDGIIDNGYVLIVDGKVSAVGGMDRLPRIRATTIDLEGKHITPGLIDAHSHSGLFRFGVNESGQAVTAEVRIADSLDPGHVSLYRQLAGGVTTFNSLHGSANPIGGQSQTHKLRWGATRPEQMRMENATPGIKFALGENVKQSNWGDNYRSRYPQTRMGVETIFRDRFTAAREYAAAMKTYEQQVARIRMLRIVKEEQDRRIAALERPRPDLELQALSEILSGERLIHCHCYRQDEILMLCNIAEEFGFTIGSFQHGLETYKVAEAVKKHSLGSSIFSDWWVFKIEVQDAIPFAGPILKEAGVNVSFNSDSDELARRMNLEAAKQLKYAQQIGIEMTPAEALHVVTIAPAIQLGIDAHVGSLEAGKDADLVVWSHNPLSTKAVAEHVFIDGAEYFSLDKDQAHRERTKSERARLIAKAIADPSKSKAELKEEAAEAGEDPNEDSDVDPSRRMLAQYYRHMMHKGFDPDTSIPGDCGCGFVNFFNELED